MWKTLRAIWQTINAISTATWLWGLPWAGFALVIGGLWAAFVGLPSPIIALVALAFGVLAYLTYVGVRLHGRTSTSSLANLKQPTDLAKLPRQKRSATDIYLDELDQVSRRTLAQARFAQAAEIAPNMLDHEFPPKREVPLSEALGWAAYGKWGEHFHGAPFTISLSGGPTIQQLLARVTDRAREGALTIWGKRDDPGHYEKIPQSHWQDNELVLADVFGSVVTGGDNPYRNLMLNRAEVEREWPHEG